MFFVPQWGVPILGDATPGSPRGRWVPTDSDPQGLPKIDPASPEMGGRMLHVLQTERQTIDWYAAQHPRIIQGTTAELGQRVLKWLTDHARYMETCRSVALVHGNLVATNVVFAGHQPRMIDWEWAEFTDPAKDLALIGGRIPADPWYIPMPPAQVDSFIDAYIEASRKYGDDGRAPGSCTDLCERRAVWEICERFGSSLAFNLKAQTEKGTLYRDTVARVHHHLSTVLAEDGY